MIPNEAVEAAAKVFARLTESEWPYQHSLSEARQILEAAAPHLMAAAWDEGKDAVWTFMSNTDPRRDRPSNPYRKAPNA